VYFRDSCNTFCCFSRKSTSNFYWPKFIQHRTRFLIFVAFSNYSETLFHFSFVFVLPVVGTKTNRILPVLLFIFCAPCFLMLFFVWLASLRTIVMFLLNLPATVQFFFFLLLLPVVRCLHFLFKNTSTTSLYIAFT
jgi:hypothetical protein